MIYSNQCQTDFFFNLNIRKQKQLFAWQKYNLYENSYLSYAAPLLALLSNHQYD